MLLDLIEIVLYTYAAIQVGYLAFFAFAALIYRDRAPSSGSSFRWCVLFPVYREDELIIRTIRDFQQKTGASGVKPDVYVLADRLKDETITELRSIGAGCIPIRLEKSTKAKSLRIAARELDDRNYDRVLIMDADNLMEEGAWDKLVHKAGPDDTAVQLHRTALNSETPMAFLDTLNEEIGNSIYRKGHVVMGLPSALIGSAMFFEWRLFYRMTHSTDEEMSGEDKFYELYLTGTENVKVKYWDDVCVLDEKVSSGHSFASQRTRWISSQYTAFARGTSGALGSLLRFNLGHFDKWLQWGFLPKFILLGLLLMACLVERISGGGLQWSMLFLIMIAAFVMAIPAKHYNKRMLGALAYAPVAMWSLLRAISGIRKGSATTFNVTDKGSQGKP